MSNIYIFLLFSLPVFMIFIMPCAKGSCLHLGFLGPTATQMKHYKTLILYKYEKVHPSLDWKVPAPDNLFEYKVFLLFPPLL